MNETASEEKHHGCYEVSQAKSLAEQCLPEWNLAGINMCLGKTAKYNIPHGSLRSVINRITNVKTHKYQNAQNPETIT